MIKTRKFERERLWTIILILESESVIQVGYTPLLPTIHLNSVFLVEHLIQINKPVAIVESEKAACILIIVIHILLGSQLEVQVD